MAADIVCNQCGSAMEEVVKDRVSLGETRASKTYKCTGCFIKQKRIETVEPEPESASELKGA